jgi:hypothetical protein
MLVHDSITDGLAAIVDRQQRDRLRDASEAQRDTDQGDRRARRASG